MKSFSLSSYYRRTIGSLLLVYIAFTPSLFAGALDISTSTEVINRLENVISQLTAEEQIPIKIRLGDLYSERARLKAIEEVDKGCINCRGSKTDRDQGIILYRDLLHVVQDEEAERVLLQLAHLYNLNGLPHKAKKLFDDVIAQKSKYHPSMVSRCYVGLAEIAFNKGDYTLASRQLNRAIGADPDGKNKAEIKRKIAWCHFNRGQITAAKNQSIEVLRMGQIERNDNPNNPSPLFVDMARDHATFLVQGTPTFSQVSQLLELAPPGEQDNLLVYLGEEAIRLGKFSFALQVWSQVAQTAKDKNQVIRAQTQIASAYYSLNRRKNLMAQLQIIQANWAKSGCTNEEICSESQGNLRQLLVLWHKKEKKKPTKDLAKAFEIYTQIFPTDVDRLFLTATIAIQVGDHAAAFQLFRKVTYQAHHELLSLDAKKDREQYGKLSTMKSESLLGAIDAAERTKIISFRQTAYTEYLKFLPQGPEAAKAQYQIAHLAYELKSYDKSTALFTAIARDRSFKESDLRLKSAHLAIDGLVASKNDQAIEKLSIEFAALFPKDRLEFLGHHRVSLQQQVRHVLATTREDRERLTKHLAGLLTVSLANASAKDQVAHWRLVVETARAANDLNMIRKGAQKILSLKSSTGPDQLFAWSHLAWVAELQLNFRQAYQYTMKLSFPRAHEKHLKLATLAELSGMRAEKHYLDFIKTTPNLNDANQVRAKLTLQDRYPVRRFAEFSSRLRRTPVLAGDLALDVYSKTNDQKFAHSIANDRLLRQTNGGRIIHRDLLLTSFRSQDVSLRRHRLSQRSMKRLADSMKQRIQSLESLERDLKIAIAMRDWTLQVVGSAILVREKNRLYQELIGLRAPYEIPRAQRAAFSQQLKQQAAPFYQSAQLLEQELNKLWSNAGALDTMISSYANIPNIRKSVARRELVALSRYTPANRIEQVSRLINERSSIPSKGQLRSAQQKVANRPFSQGDLNTLLNIAKEREEQTLVQYLLVRKEELGKGVLQ